MQQLEPKGYADRDKPAPVTSDPICLGQQAKLSDDLSVYFYLYWYREPEEDFTPLGIAIDLWVKDRSKRDQLAAKLDQQHLTGGPCSYYRGEDFSEFWIPLNESDFPKFDEKLDELFDYTIKYLKSVKDIASYFKP